MSTEADVLGAALRRAYNLGQVYWQQADSEYTSQHRKADETQAKFDALLSETVAALARAVAAEPDDFMQSVRRLCVVARTTGGTAGRDEGLCAALDRVEAMLLAIADPDWQAQASQVVAAEPFTYLVERSAFRVSPHGQDAESNEWLEEAKPDEPGAFPVYRHPPPTPA